MIIIKIYPENFIAKKKKKGAGNSFLSSLEVKDCLMKYSKTVFLWDRYSLSIYNLIFITLHGSWMIPDSGDAFFFSPDLKNEKIHG